ncbi:unnamed protein product [Blepharisma stoltei]|uniref:CRAL-TRIO domain-containing protein n=1 Tax=Blepharisma stoltei TaxID=1481888 RepID=A0AAU9J7L1_9CILI|nr:unnamed protein product [Blepharisma stoltei]
MEERKQQTTPLPTLLGTLTPEERQTLVRFKEALGGNFDDHTLGRFLRARKFNFDKAMEMFQNYLRWRQEFGVDQIMSYEFPELEQVKACYPHGFHKTDSHGRPIYIERIGSLDLKRLFEITTEERMIRYYVKSYETMLNVQIPACAIAAGHPVEQSLTILDLGGSSTKLMSKKVYKFIQMASKIGQDYYPEMLGRMFIVNTPMLFSVAWKVIRPWLDERTQHKISLEGSKFQKKLLELAPADNVPHILGGNCNCERGCLYSNAGPWNDPLIQAQIGIRNVRVSEVAELESQRKQAEEEKKG